MLRVYLIIAPAMPSNKLVVWCVVNALQSMDGVWAVMTQCNDCRSEFQMIVQDDGYNYPLDYVKRRIKGLRVIPLKPEQ